MLQYLQADLYRMRKERKLWLSFTILIVISLLTNIVSLGDLTTDNLAEGMGFWGQLAPLFFIAPANLFFAEDMTLRTINNSVVKSSSRLPLFAYKFVMAALVSMLYLLVPYVIYGLFASALGLTSVWGLIIVTFLNQLPLAICLAFLCQLIVLVIGKPSLSNIVFIMMALFLDSLLLVLFLQMNFPFIVPFLLFQNLQSLVGATLSWGLVQAIALAFAVIYAVLAYRVFNQKEFK